MVTFTDESVKAFDRAAKSVGTYLGWYESMLDKLKNDIDEAPLGFMKRMAAKAAVRKMKKAFIKEERDFTAVIEELGKLGLQLDESDFIEKCRQVERTIIPLFTRIRSYSNEITKIINIVKFTIKRKEA